VSSFNLKRIEERKSLRSVSWLILLSEGVLKVKIEKDVVAGLAYTLKNGEGEILDQSEQGDPLYYIHGRRNLIPGLENELEGKKLGDKLSVTIAPVDGYGERNEQLVQIVEHTSFENPDEIEEGFSVEMEDEQGKMIFTVVERRENEFVLDGNHPLAGETLHFDVEVTEVRNATKDELAHGHVHGEGCHHH
jgi:FKBP-type peptidyl-prolyl cis-trans isomerase SlyD